MKKTYYVFLVTLLLSVTQTVWAVNYSDVSSKESYCPWFVKNATLYIEGDKRIENVYDQYWAGEERAISNLHTDVKLWQSNSGLISGCNNAASWLKWSDFTPASKEKQIAIAASCTFNKPVDKNKRTLQFVFNIWNYKIYEGWSQNYDFIRRNKAQWTNWTSTRKSFNNVYLGDFRKHGNECLNIELQYCGDGVKNWAEQCDSADPSKAGWGTNGCTNSCKADNNGWGNPVCWDAIKNGTEQCDFADPLKIGWGTNGCTNTCTEDNWTTSSSSSWGWSSSSSSGWSSSSSSWGWSSSSSGGGSSSSSSWGWSSSSSGGWSSSSWGWSSSSSGGWSSSSSGWATAYCGDKIVQRDRNEECEIWLDGVFPSYCSSTTCKYDTHSIPADGSLKFWPKDTVVIWDSMNPYIAHTLEKPFVKNTGKSELVFDEICVVKQSSNSSLVWNPEVCKSFDTVLKPGDTLRFDSYPDYVWKVTGVPWSDSFGDTKLITTLRHKGTLYPTAHFATDLEVRVAKPTIATIGGGTNMLQASSNLSNLSKIASSTYGLDANKNQNFIWAWISSWDYSSHSRKVSETSTITKLQDEGGEYSNDLNWKIDTVWSAIATVTTLDHFQKYNGLPNVFILKNKNLEVNSDLFSSIPESRTYIIENWNLNIYSNINIWNANIAFVVKGGNINIDDAVSKLEGTFVTLKKWLSWWKFQAFWGNTLKQLRIEWSAYGNIVPLASKRVYVKANSDGLLDVWTVVDYTSNVLYKPAPLIGKFIWDYLAAQKIAK